MENIENLQMQLRELSESIQKDIESEIDIDAQIIDPIRESIKTELQKLTESIEKLYASIAKKYEETHKEPIMNLSSIVDSISQSLVILNEKIDENAKEISAGLDDLKKDQSEYLKQIKKKYGPMLEKTHQVLGDQVTMLENLSHTAKSSQSELIENLKSVQQEVGIQRKKMNLQFWGTIGTLLIFIIILLLHMTQLT